jgi:hypothetical protein
VINTPPRRHPREIDQPAVVERRPEVGGQVLNLEHNPICGLYGAGNCIALSPGQAYRAGGSTLSPALSWCAIAGKNAVASNELG